MRLALTWHRCFRTALGVSRRCFASSRKVVKAVTCVDGQPQSMAAAQILSRMLKHGEEVWVYRALKVHQATESVDSKSEQPEQEEAQRSVEEVAEVVRERSGLGEEVMTHVSTVMSPGAAVTRFVGEKSADFVALGSHGQGRVLHKSLASYLMQSFAHTRILVCPLKDWAPTQARGLKYTVVFDGCQTSRNALEVLSSFTTEEDTVEILHAHVVPQPAPRGKFRTTMTPPSEEELAKALQDSEELFQEAAGILRGGSVKEVLGTHIQVLPGQQLGEQLLDKAIGNKCDVLVAGTKAMPGIGSWVENFMKGRTVMGVLKSSLTVHLLNNAVEVPVLYIN